MTVALTILLLLFSVLITDFTFASRSWNWTEKELCNKLFDCEKAIDATLKSGPFIRTPGNLGIILTTIVMFSGFYCIKSLVEGRCGITCGKALVGIRTVSSTLRPCGFARALLRDLLYCIDIPLLVTPLPASISIVLTEHRKRLGDRVADTLVIVAGSVSASDDHATRSTTK